MLDLMLITCRARADDTFATRVGEKSCSAIPMLDCRSKHVYSGEDTAKQK
jgi:hypothetical protein